MGLQDKYLWPSSIVADQMDIIDRRLHSTRDRLEQECFDAEMRGLTNHNKQLAGLIERLEFVFSQMGINPRETKHWSQPIPTNQYGEPQADVEVDNTPPDGVKIEVRPRPDLENAKEVVATYPCNGKMFEKNFLVEADVDLASADLSNYYAILRKSMKRRYEAEGVEWTQD